MTCRLHVPSFSQTQWTSCRTWSLEWAAPTGTRPCTVFSCKDCCGSTFLGMNMQTGKHSRYHMWSAAWQGRGSPRLKEPSEHGQTRASQHWLPEGKRSGERKQPTFHPLRLGMICFQPDKQWHSFEGNLGETAEWEMGWSTYRPFRGLQCHLELKLKNRNT